MEVGGLADESAGQPVRIKGTIAGVVHAAGRVWVGVAFGRGNVVLLSEYLTQVMYPADLKASAIDQFKVFAIKSRVHFRRGFDDSGFAKTILLVEPEQPVPRHGAARRAALQERRYPQVLSLRRRELPVGSGPGSVLREQHPVALHAVVNPPRA
jgi:microcystin degradation protein MlrC